MGTTWPRTGSKEKKGSLMSSKMGEGEVLTQKEELDSWTANLQKKIKSLRERARELAGENKIRKSPKRKRKMGLQKKGSYEGPKREA